jgi:hypothetical protein
MTVSFSTISGNGAADPVNLWLGGGISNYGQLTLTSSTVSGNAARYGGGGLNNGGQLVVRHSTITGNQLVDAFVVGAGIVSNTQVTVENSLVAGNVSQFASIQSDVSGSLTGSYNLIGDPDSAGGFVHGVNGNIVGDGLGGVLDINTVLDTTLSDNGGPTLTHALVPGSPALDTGDPNFAPPPATDQRGAPRVFRNRIDIGAYEDQNLSTPINGVIVVDIFEDLIADDNLWSLCVAVIYANNDPGDNEIRLAAGTYALTIQGKNEQAAQTGNLNILDAGSLKVVGSGTEATIIDASGLYPSPSSAELRGGILDIQGGEFQIEGTTLRGAFGTRGSAIYNSGNATMIASAIVDNTSSIFGDGAISNQAQGQMAIIRSQISGNDGFLGAGVANYGEMTIGECTISDNMVVPPGTGGGAGVVNSGQMTIRSSTISGNGSSDPSRSVAGGGILNSGELLLVESTVSGNEGVNGGGGIRNDGQLISRHSTITGNRGTGGGILLSPGSTATLEHTIVAGNFAGSEPSTTPSDIQGSGVLTASYSLIGDPATAGGLVNGVNGNIVGDGLGGVLDINTVLDTTLADNGGPTLTHKLVPGSPAINAGNPAFVPPPEFDQRGEGFPRVIRGRVDIGAYENSAPSTPVNGVIIVDIFEDIIDDDGLWSLREAVIYANNDPGDNEIRLANGAYLLSRDGGSSTSGAEVGDLNISNRGSLQILGTGGAQATTIDASGLSRGLFFIDGATVRLQDVTLTGAKETGAILNVSGGNTTILDSALIHNSSRFGNGGGAIYNSQSSQLALHRSTVSHNQVSFAFGPGGGGIFNAGTMLVADSTISNNSSSTSGSDGGGIYNRGQLTIERSTIANNGDGGIAATITRFGGGIYNSGHLTLSDSTVSGNLARIGAGIYNDQTLIIRNSTLTLNRAGQLVGGLALHNGSTTILEHTIVAGNFSGPDGDETPSDLIMGTASLTASYSLIGDPATAGGLVNGVNGNIVGDGLGGVLDINTVLDTTLADNGGPTLTHKLVPGSPAINAGDPAFVPPPEFDQRGPGFARVTGGRIDIGAYEFGSVPSGTVLARHVFYNNSIYDGHDAGINLADNDAVDPSKQALLPGGGLAGPQNVTSYSRGINGIIVDVAGSHPAITAADFTFRVGANNDPDSWTAAPAPSGLAVFITPTSTRVVITWADGAIVNTYLQVIVAANDNTELTEEDVFFFGNRIGDTFNNLPPSTFVANAVDEIAIRSAMPANNVPVTSVFDLDKNGRLDAIDVLLARSNRGFLNRIQIAPPAPPAVSAAVLPTSTETRVVIPRALTAAEVDRALAGDEAEDTDDGLVLESEPALLLLGDEWR